MYAGHVWSSVMPVYSRFGDACIQPCWYDHELMSSCVECTGVQWCVSLCGKTGVWASDHDRFLHQKCVAHGEPLC